MVELVFALLLIQDHKIVEHRIKDSLIRLFKIKTLCYERQKSW